MMNANRTPDATLHVQRILDAPRERVFRAWTDPAWIARWWGSPDGVKHIEVDFRVGGHYRYTVKEPSGDAWYLVGTYQEITPPEKLVYTWAFENTLADYGPATLVTVEFVAHGDQTEVIVTHERFQSDESRIAHSGGWEQCLDEIAALLREGFQP
jgi:uncharacterized protein YndB with AHSA1/START domain